MGVISSDLKFWQKEGEGGGRVGLRQREGTAEREK